MQSESLQCEFVCNPETRQGCIKYIGETAIYMSTEADIEKSSDINESIEQRLYQTEAWDTIKQSRDNGDKSCLIHLATGLGKTTLAVVDALRYITEFNQGKPEGAWVMPRILFAVHQNEILDQAAQRFTQLAPQISQGFFNDKAKNLNQPLVFATMQSLHENLEQIPKDQFDYIIYDEAHHAQAETFKKVVGHFTPNFQLALTATPNRMDGLVIRALFGPEKYTKTLAEALTEGWLADVDYHIVMDQTIQEAMKSGFEGYTLKAIAELLDNQSRNQIIIEQIRQEIEKLGLLSSKTILFCQTVEHANEMADLLGGKAYHSKLSDDEKAKTLNNFKRGGLNLIATRDMFNEGVDIPDARLVIFLRSTGSRTIFEQQLGRGLRKAPGKDTVTVLDFVANIEHLRFLKDFADETKQTQIKKENEQRGISIKHEDSTNDGGLKISVPHTDFDFSRLAVDLLDALDRIKADLNKWSTVNDQEFTAWALQLGGGKPISAAKMDEYSKLQLFPSSSYIKSRFGTISAFTMACGFEPTWKGATNQELIEAIQQMGFEKAPTKSQIEQLAKLGKMPTPATIRNRFGSMQAFNEQAGFLPQLNKTSSNQQIIDRALLLSPDSPITLEQVRGLSAKGTFTSITTITNRFGSLDKFREQCGYKRYPNGSYRKSQTAHTAEFIIQMAKDTGVTTPFKKTQIDELSKQGKLVSVPTIKKHFGSVKEFNKALGLI